MTSWRGITHLLIGACVVDSLLLRKYRILDDCARLREVFQSLPDERRYVPSILFVVWGEAEQTALPEDMEKMVRYAFPHLCGMNSFSIGEGLERRRPPR
jgi:hypothetical protein